MEKVAFISGANRGIGFETAKKLAEKGIKVILVLEDHKFTKDLNSFDDLVFISPSNISPKFSNNIISIGVSLESQLISLINFIKKKKEIKQ